MPKPAASVLLLFIVLVVVEKLGCGSPACSLSFFVVEKSVQQNGGGNGELTGLHLNG
jgi:hypothetical protein